MGKAQNLMLRYGWWAETYHVVSLKDSQLSNNLCVYHKAVWFFSEDSIFLIASNWFQFHEPVQSSFETVQAFRTYNMMQQEISFLWSEEFFFFFVFCLMPVSISSCLLLGTLDDHSCFLFQSISFGQKSFVEVSSWPNSAHIPAVTSQVENFSFRKLVTTTHSVTILFYQAECSS